MRVFRRELGELVSNSGGGYSGFDVSGGSGRWPGSATIWSPVSQMGAAASIARKRISYLAENSPLCAAIETTFIVSAVGDGPTCRSNISDPDERAEIERRWTAFAAACDAEGIVDLAGLLARVCRAFIRDGESFVRFAVDDDMLRLQLLSADQVDASATRFGNLTGQTSPRIMHGVEVDAGGRVVAYWVLPSQPDIPAANVGSAVRVSADDVAHLYEPRFPGQLRGVSPLAAVATRLLEVDMLEDAAIKKAQVAALMTGFVRDVGDSTGIVGEASKIDPAQLSLEPGTLRVLPPGTDVSFTPSTDVSSLAEILRHMARSACAGSGVPYVLAASDLGETNFSSAQIGMTIFKRRMRAFQQNHLVSQLLARVWRRWMLLEVLTGRLRAPGFEANPESYLTATWLFAGWPALDAAKEAKATALDLQSRVKSRAQVISEMGRDPADVDAEIMADPMRPDLSATADATLAEPEVPTDADA